MSGQDDATRALYKVHSHEDGSQSATNDGDYRETATKGK